MCDYLTHEKILVSVNKKSWEWEKKTFVITATRNSYGMQIVTMIILKLLKRGILLQLMEIGIIKGSKKYVGNPYYWESNWLRL